MIKRTKSLFFIISILPAFLSADYSWEMSPAEHLVQEGIIHLYNYQMEAAISTLDSAWKIDNTHPVVPFVLIAGKWLQAQIKEGYEASYDKINIEVDITIPVYEKLINQFPNNAEYQLYLGSTYGIRARTALAGKEWLKVLYYSYQGLKYIRKAKEMDNELIDVYMPIGLMEYFSCLSPTPVRWAARLGGLSADCELGIQYLEKAASESHYSWIEASNVLCYIYLHIQRDYEKASITTSRLVKDFPGHPYFAFLRGELLAKTHRWDELEELMPSLRQFADQGPFLQKNECQLKLTYIEGLHAYYHQNYNGAMEKCNWMLDNYHMEFDWLKGFAHLLRGQSYYAIGEFELAKVEFKEVIKMDNYYPEVREAELYLEKNLSLKRE